jgi:hypothetical protein
MFGCICYRIITNDVSDYINVLVGIAHKICNHLLFVYILTHYLGCLLLLLFVYLWNVVSSPVEKKNN